MKKQLNVASLFAGVGGIDLGFLQAKNDKFEYNLVIANEFDPFASITYRHNFQHQLVEGDITKIFPSKLDKKNKNDKYEELKFQMLREKIDVLTAGFPCQAFSIAGDAKGFDDHRGNLFLNIIEYIKEIDKAHGKPRFLFLENVKNLKSHDKGRTYSIIKISLENLGYTIKERILNTKDYTNIPQNRERIFIIGFANKNDADKFDLFDEIQKKKIKHTSDEWEAIVDKLLFDKVSDKYYYTSSKYPHYFNNDKINIENEITEKLKFYQLRRGLYVRKNQNHVCPTLTANMGTGGHNVPLILNSKGIRKLTPDETFILQGYPIGNGYELPKKYNDKVISDSKFYKQAGNSVSVPLIKFLAEELLKIL